MGRAPRVAIVVKRSAWRIYVEERHDERLRELASVGDVTVAPLKASHEAHVRTVREVKEALASLGANIVVERAAGEPFDAAGVDLVVTVDQDSIRVATTREGYGIERARVASIVEATRNLPHPERSRRTHNRFAASRA